MMSDRARRLIRGAAVPTVSQPATPSANFGIWRLSDCRRCSRGPNYLSQRLIDPVLPARSGFLKVIKYVSVNSQSDKLLGIRDSRTLRMGFLGLRGCPLERPFSRIPSGG